MADDKIPPQNCYDDNFKEWREGIQYQRKSDLKWLDKLIGIVEKEHLFSGGSLDRLDVSEKNTRANIRWYMDLLRWQHDLIRWEREDLEWERKLQSSERAASRETAQASRAQQERRNNESPIKAKKIRQHRKRKPKRNDQSAS